MAKKITTIISLSIKYIFNNELPRSRAARYLVKVLIVFCHPREDGDPLYDYKI